MYASSVELESAVAVACGAVPRLPASVVDWVTVADVVVGVIGVGVAVFCFVVVVDTELVALAEDFGLEVCLVVAGVDVCRDSPILPDYKFEKYKNRV